jgi:TRAP-type C4-dicarboxylate transport system permease small subunit
MSLSTIVTALRHAEEFLLSVLLVAMILLSCTQIGLRLFYDGGLNWVDPLLRYLVVWSGFLGALLAVSREKHITIDISQFILPQGLLKILRIVIGLFSSVVCGFLTYASWLFIGSEMEFGSSSLLRIPAWGWNLIFPLAFAGMTFRFLLVALAKIADLRRSFPIGEEDGSR